MMKFQLLTLCLIYFGAAVASDPHRPHHRRQNATLVTFDAAGKKMAQCFILQKSLDEAHQDELLIGRVEAFWANLSVDTKHSIIENKKVVRNNLTKAFVTAINLEQANISLDYKKESLKYPMDKNDKDVDCLSCLYPSNEESLAMKMFETALLETVKETIRVKISELRLD